MPPLPKLGQGFKGGAGGLPGLNNPFSGMNLTGDRGGGASGGGFKLPHLAAPPNTQPLFPIPNAADIPSQAPTQAGLHLGPLTTIGMGQQDVRTAAAEARAIRVMKAPHKYDKTDLAVQQILANPTPTVVNAVSNKGDLKNLQGLNTKATGDLNKHISKNIYTSQKVEGGELVQPATQAGFAPHVSKFQQIMSDVQHRLAGIGPGLVKEFGIDAPKEVYNLIAHPGSQGPGMHPLTADINAQLGTIKESLPFIGHPVRQWQQDPVSLLTNAATLPFAGAGAVARASELARVEDVAAARGVSVPKQIATTLLRPQPMDRALSAQFGKYSDPFTLTPPAYKSALGGYLQKYIGDPLLERHLNNPASSIVPDRFRQIFNSKFVPVSAANRFGRKARLDFEADIRGRAGALSTRMPEPLANSLARGTAFIDRWDALHKAGATADEAAQQPWRDWHAIKAPPSDLPRVAPEYLTPQQIQNYKALTINSEDELARQFKPGSRMIATDKEIAADPNKFSYVPKDLVNSLKTYERGTGTAASALNLMDRGTQVIRSGRFLTPAYSQWAVQNGLIHASQAGAMIFRNAWQLRKEWPQLPAEIRAAIDGWMGKGIARSTAGGEAAVESRLGRATQGAREFWHRFDDQWARRMSAIHELNSNGYHDAGAWTKLYKKDRKRMQQIVGGQANREAINYTEMTPAERGSLQKMMTAYGWTRGASTFTGRFPLQHPIQAFVGESASKQGQQAVENFYNKLGGMVPEYLRESLPIGSHTLLPTSEFSPAGTLANILGEVPGLTYGQTQALSGEEAPIPALIDELRTGMNQYGQQYRGNERVTGPIKEALGRFKPYGLATSLLPAFQKKGGTFVQSPAMTGAKALGLPIEQLRNPKVTAGLGEKDFEAALSPPDKIRFQYQRKLDNLQQELAMFQKRTGNPVDPGTVSRLKSDFDSVEQRDIFQYQYAQAHGSKTWKSLPPLNKLAGTLDWLGHHGFPHAEIASIQQFAPQMTDDKQVEALVNRLWQGTGIGRIESRWKSVTKGLNPPTLTPSQ